MEGSNTPFAYSVGAALCACTGVTHNPMITELYVDFILDDEEEQEGEVEEVTPEETE